MVGLVCRLTDHDAAAGRGPPGAASCAGPAARAGATGRAAWRAVDLGCGNGALLVALAKEGRARRPSHFSPRLCSTHTLKRISRLEPFSQTSVRSAA